MALSLNAPNFPGIGNVGNAQISVPGALGLEAFKTGLSAKELEQRKMLELMQLQQQEAQSRRSANIQQQAMNQQASQQERQGLLAQREMGLKERQTGMQGSQFQDELAYKQQALQQQGALGQGALDVDKQKLFQEQQQREMAKLLEEKKETLREKGAYVSYALLSLNDAKTPEEAHQMWTEISKEAEGKKYLTPEMSKQMSQMPLSQRKNMLKGMLVNLGVASEYKAMQPEKEKSAGTKEIYDPETGNLIYSSTPTTSMISETQKELSDREMALQKLIPIRDEFKEKYFTNRGRFEKWISQTAEENTDIPIVGNLNELAAKTVTGGKTKEERAQFIRDSSKYINSIEQFFQGDYRKPITGAGAGLDEIKDLRKNFMNGQMSPSEFLGALDQVVIKYTSESEFKKNILNKGIDVTPAGNEGLIKAFKAAGKTDAEIEAYLRSKK